MGLIDKNFVKKFYPIFSQYKYFEICRAVFCLNSWRYNRPNLSAYLTLNYVLSICDRNGSTQINTYDQFIDFCKLIKPTVNGSMNDDIIPDFGEIKISFNNKYYPVLIGNGYNHSYPFMKCLESNISAIGKDLEIEEVLSYLEQMVDSLQMIEPFNENNYEIYELSIPSKEYFNACLDYYQYITPPNNWFIRKLSTSEQKDITKAHFLIDNNSLLPLFNPSIIIDSFDTIIQDMSIDDNKRNQMADRAVYSRLCSNFDISPDSSRILISIGIVEDLAQQKLLEQTLFNFALINNKSLVLFINKQELCNCNITHIYNKIKNLHKSKNLKIVQILKGEAIKLFDFSNIDTVEVVFYDNNIQLGVSSEYVENNKIACCDLYDLISIIDLAENGDDIAEFFKKYYSKELESSVIYSGLSGLFETWLTTHKEFSQGAYEFNNILYGVYDVEWDLFKKYLTLNDWFPFVPYSEMFNDPCRWLVHGDTENHYKHIYNKATNGFGGSFRKVSDSFLFLAYNISFEDENDQWNLRADHVKMIQELTERNLVLIEDALIKAKLYLFDGVQITYMPMQYAQKVNNNHFLSQNKKYVFSDCYVCQNKLLIRYAVNEENLLKDLIVSKTKTVECDFIAELLSCLDRKFDIESDIINQKIDSLRCNKKDIEAIAIEQKYYFSFNNEPINPSDSKYILVRKHIAKICQSVGLNSGIYSGNDATTVVRKLQELIIPKFEDEIKKFDKISLHKKAVSILAGLVHNKNLDMKRYSLSERDSLSEEAKERTITNIIINREETKNKIRDLNYLIDTNLSLSRESKNIVKQDDLEFLIAFSHWLVLLQDCADQAHYGLFNAQINIEDDFKVSTKYPNDEPNYANTQNRRIYDNRDYIPHIENENQWLDKTLKAFYDDTKVKLENIIFLCDNYLAFEFYATFKEQSEPDVFEIKKDALISDLKSILIDKTQLPELIEALNYLTIKMSKIKSIGTESTSFVPIWEREKRDQRFDVRPIVANGDNIIFSPVLMYELSTMWKVGIREFYPTYEIDLNKFTDTLRLWKSECELKMETEIAELCKKVGFTTYKNLEIHNLDKTHCHPKDLGDYDVVAIDIKNKVVWNLESKFLIKVGSIKEYANHQSSFFLRNKKDEKFTKRIKYLSEHLIDFLKSINIDQPNLYKLKNYMITNKVFTSPYKKLDFEIITFYELEQLLTKQ